MTVAVLSFYKAGEEGLASFKIGVE